MNFFNLCYYLYSPNEAWLRNGFPAMSEKVDISLTKIKKYISILITDSSSFFLPVRHFFFLPLI